MLDQDFEIPSENEEIVQICFLGIKTLGIDFKNCIFNEYLRSNNQCWKPDPILESRETNIVDDFEGKSNKSYIIQKLIEFIQLLQYEEKLKQKIHNLMKNHMKNPLKYQMRNPIKINLNNRLKYQMRNPMKIYLKKSF